MAREGLRLRQDTAFPDEERTLLTIEASRPVSFELRLRIPGWATRGGSVKVNGETLAAFASPGSFLTLLRTWKSGDRVELTLPMALTTRAMPDDPSLQAAMYGPIVLAGRLGTQGLTPEMTYGGYDCELSGKPLEVDDIAGSWTDPASWLEASTGRPLAFRTKKDKLGRSISCR